MAVDRGSRDNKRQRREFQRLGDNPLGHLGIIGGDGITTDPDTDTISIDIGTDSGLEIINGELFVNVDENFGLSLHTSGIRIDLAASSGLEFTGGDLRIDIRDAVSVFAIDANGLYSPWITVSGSSGNEGVLIAGGSGSGTQELRHPATNGGRFVANSSSAVMRIGTGGAGLSISTTSADFSLVSVSQLRVFNSSTGSGASDPAFQLLASSTLLQGFSGAITSRPRAPTLGGAGSANTMGGGNAATSGAGGPATVQGGQAAGSNQNGGTVDIVAGQPTGSGVATARIRSTSAAGTQTTRIEANITGIGFFGVAPIAQPGTYTITAAPAVSRDLNADANGGAYTGVPLALLDAATVADLNDLRADVASIAAVLRQVIRDQGDTAGLGLVNETGY